MRIVVPAMLALVVTAIPLHAQRPWLKADARFEQDNQVRSAQHVRAEFGGYLSPAFTLALTLAADHVTGDLPASGTSESSTVSAGPIVTLSLPATRLGIEAGGSALFAGNETELLYSATTRLHLGAGTALRVRARREHYTATLASLDTLLLVRTFEVALDRAAAPGWAGEAVASRSDFGDSNPINTAYAWLLMPLSRSAQHSVRAGFAAAWQDSEHSNWVPSGGSASPESPQHVPGRYVPYYTPHDLQTLHILVNGATALGKGWVLLDGAFGVHATETAPLLVRPSAPSQAAPTLQFYDRSFTPLRAQLSLIMPANDRTTLTITGSYDRTAYYRTGAVRAMVARNL